MTRLREPYYSMIWKASIGYNDSWSQIDPEVLEKYSDAIVRQCIELIQQSSQTDVDMVFILDAISSHFGVDCLDKE